MKILNKCILITTQGQGTKFYCGKYPEDKKRPLQSGLVGVDHEHST